MADPADGGALSSNQYMEQELDRRLSEVERELTADVLTYALAMAKRVNMQDIMARNPKVDEGRVAEVRDVRRRLHQLGMKPQRYDLASPFEARPKGRRTPTRSNAALVSDEEG